MVTALTLLIASTCCTVEKPPKATYDKVRNETTWSTGEVKFRSSSGFRYWCGFSFPGKEPVAPETLMLGFVMIRSVDSKDNRPDSEHAQWSNVRTIALRWAADPKEYTCKYERKAIKDDMSAILGFRTFAEFLYVQLPIEDVRSLSASKEVLIGLGGHNDQLGEKHIKNFKKLVDAIGSI